MKPATTETESLSHAEPRSEGNNKCHATQVGQEERPPLSAKELDQRFAQAMGENSEWFNTHAAEILRQHPEWYGKDLAICSRTSSKILAVGDDRYQVLNEGLKSIELLAVARREGMPPGMLLTAVIVGDVY